METQIKFVVVGHHTRRHQAEQLAWSLRAHLLIDEGQHGANWNHHRAIVWASEQDCRVVILEDDALPVHGFTEGVSEWLEQFPDDLLSFYLGTGRPPQYQLEIATKLIEADISHADHITINRLIHGLCYSIPQAKLPQVISQWNSAAAADYAIGDAYGSAVVYPCYSLADHTDAEAVEHHPDKAPRIERRRAWRLKG